MASYNADNPIRIVKEILPNGTTTAGAYVPAPTEYEWSLQDLSDAQAGRTEDESMHKNRTGQKIKLNLLWELVSKQDASDILTAFDPEYVAVTYEDAKTGTFIEKAFYVTDRNAPALNMKLGVWKKISFSIVEV